LYVAALSFLTVGPPQVSGHEVTFQPGPTECKDAYIWEALPDTNYGDSEYLKLGYDDGRLDFLIKFNDLDSYIDENAQFHYGELQLYVGIALGGGNNIVAPVASDWSERTLTWNSNPGCNEDIFAHFDAPPAGDWLTVEITEIVQGWLRGSLQHHGFYVFATYRYGVLTFWSGEYTDPDLRPCLYLEYTYTGVAPVSLGEIKTGFR
jgi:hypothetical protein